MAMDKSVYFKINFLIFVPYTWYAVGTQKNRLNETFGSALGQW